MTLSCFASHEPLVANPPIEARDSHDRMTHTHTRSFDLGVVSSKGREDNAGGGHHGAATTSQRRLSFTARGRVRPWWRLHNNGWSPARREGERVVPDLRPGSAPIIAGEESSRRLRASLRQKHAVVRAQDPFTTKVDSEACGGDEGFGRDKRFGAVQKEMMS